MSPATSNVVSRVTAWSTFRVPFTVVITPAEAKLTILVAVIFEEKVFSPATVWFPIISTALSRLDFKAFVKLF